MLLHTCVPAAGVWRVSRGFSSSWLGLHGSLLLPPSLPLSLSLSPPFSLLPPPSSFFCLSLCLSLLSRTRPPSHLCAPPPPPLSLSLPPSLFLSLSLSLSLSLLSASLSLSLTLS